MKNIHEIIAESLSLSPRQKEFLEEVIVEMKKHRPYYTMANVFYNDDHQVKDVYRLWLRGVSAKDIADAIVKDGHVIKLAKKLGIPI